MTIYKGWNAQIYYSETGTISPSLIIGNADAASVEVSTGTEAYYEIGKRTPVQIVEGNEEITGSFSRAWINKDYLRLLSPDPSGTTALTEFAIGFKVRGDAGPFIYCYGCKLETGSLDIPQDGVLKEDYDFRATMIVVG